MEASEGLNAESLEDMLAEKANVYSRSSEQNHNTAHPKILTKYGEQLHVAGWATILEALNSEEASEVFLNGRKVFEKQNNCWCFTGDEN